MKAYDDEQFGADEAMLEMITDLQSERIDSQRALLRPAGTAPPPATPAVGGKGSSLPGLRHQHTLQAKPEDDFLDMIARVQGSRLEEQRTELPRREGPPGAPLPAQPQQARTVPDDDFFAFLMRAQAARMEDQRATIPIQTNRDAKNGSNSKK